jgi:hypothetical protein
MAGEHREEQGDDICIARTAGDPFDDDNLDALEANARLIAAAPEIFDCLLAYVQLEEEAAPYSSSPMRERAREALAKAGQPWPPNIPRRPI